MIVRHLHSTLHLPLTYLSLIHIFLSILLGSLAYLFPLVKELLDPVMLLIKSVPVASFVILALIWIGSRNLAVFTSFLVVVPMVYVSTLSGLEHTDKKLLEMARVFSIPMWKRIHYIYVPALLPYLDVYKRQPQSHASAVPPDSGEYPGQREVPDSGTHC